MGWSTDTCDQIWLKSVKSCPRYKSENKSMKCWQKKEETERNRTDEIHSRRLRLCKNKNAPRTVVYGSIHCMHFVVKIPTGHSGSQCNAMPLITVLRSVFPIDVKSKTTVNKKKKKKKKKMVLILANLYYLAANFVSYCGKHNSLNP